MPDSSDIVERWRRLRNHPELVAAAVQADGDPLAIQTSLRKRFDEIDLIPLAMQLREVRQKAAGRFSYAAELWADRIAIEQATTEIVADYKALRFAGRAETVHDLCCGMGADSLALLRHAAVEAVDLRPEALAFTEWNASLIPRDHELTTTLADVTSRAWSGLVHLDPDRRPEGQRVRRLEQCRPDLEFMQTVAAGRGGAIKLSPASNFGGKFAGCESELISFGGECREATIWFGELSDGELSRATALTADGQATSIAGDPLDSLMDVVPLGDIIIDPEPAVVRAGLLDELCSRSGLGRIDDAEEYLTIVDEAAATASPLRPLFGQEYLVLDRTGTGSKHVRKMLRSHGVGRLEVKTRHLSIDANAMQRKFQTAGKDDDRIGVLFYARVAGKSQAVLAKRLIRTSMMRGDGR